MAHEAFEALFGGAFDMRFRRRFCGVGGLDSNSPPCSFPSASLSLSPKRSRSFFSFPIFR